MTAPTTAYAFGFGCVAVILIYVGKRYFGNTQSPCPLPPGPRGLPWIGNVIGINTNAPWLTYHEWAKIYGDLIHCQLLGRDIIIISSEKVARDILDKGSSNNSDRPCLITSDLCGLGFNSALLPYGDRWRLHRRFFHQTFHAGAVSRFLPVQHTRVCRLLRGLLHSSHQFDEHVFEYTASIVLNSTYDYDPPALNDELFELVIKVQEVSLSVVRPDTAIIISTFPILLELPAWFPGMSFKNDMLTASKLIKRCIEQSFEYALQRMQSCYAASSMVNDAMQSIEKRGIVPDEAWTNGIKEAAATSFLAGSETSHAVLLVFILMMMLNPEAQENAQAQIDAVVGKTRLPMMNDRPLLPFVDAIYQETLRYCPVVPLSVPHAAVDDYVYNGFHIPKGAILLTNLWSITHDESRYPDPHVFMPERFLNEDSSLKPNDINNIVFGFGRRICVGRHFADMSLWSAIAKILAVFKILKPLDENGTEITIEPKFSSGLATRPLPFECRIVPRIPGMSVEKLEELIAASPA